MGLALWNAFTTLGMEHSLPAQAIALICQHLLDISRHLKNDNKLEIHPPGHISFRDAVDFQHGSSCLELVTSRDRDAKKESNSTGNAFLNSSTYQA